jgi:hypothetical protein
MKETKMDRELNFTAYCGLYCGDCIRYQSKASGLAAELMKELDESQFAEYAKIKSGPEKQLDAVREFSNFKECRDALQAIAAVQCNTPCREGGGCSAFSCGILECCSGKGFSGCWECDLFEGCEKLDDLSSIHGDSPRENLRAVNKYGFPDWTQHRSKPYIWQQE